MVWLVARSRGLVVVIDVAAVKSISFADVDFLHVLSELALDPVDVLPALCLEALTDIGVVKVPRRPAPDLGGRSGRSRQGR